MGILGPERWRILVAQVTFHAVGLCMSGTCNLLGFFRSRRTEKFKLQGRILHFIGYNQSNDYTFIVIRKTCTEYIDDNNNNISIRSYWTLPCANVDDSMKQYIYRHYKAIYLLKARVLFCYNSNEWAVLPAFSATQPIILYLIEIASYFRPIKAIVRDIVRTLIRQISRHYS